MGRFGKISTIRKDYSNSQIQTMQGGLAKKGLTRVPGTGVFKYPYKEFHFDRLKPTTMQVMK